MGEVMAIASSFWKRILGMKVVYFLIICAITLIAITNLYDTLMIKEEKALMVDAAMFLTTIAGILSVLSLSFDIPKELSSGIASVLLSKPLGRTQYLIGKVVGTSVVGMFISGSISIGYFVIYSMSHGKIPIELIQASFLAVISVIPMAAIVLLFSSFLSEAASATASFIVIWFSYSAGALNIPLLSGGIIPELSVFDMGAEAFYLLKISNTYLFFGFITAISTAIVLTITASLIFNTRDI